jgi:NADH-quinone oxidoreductase subunit K
VTVGHVITLAGVLFTTGMVGVMLRRNILIMLLSVELMLNAAALAFVGFAARWGNLDGQVMVFFAIAVAAAEVAVGLAIVIALFRLRVTVDTDRVSLMKK